mgnify:CR=1 FL=1
MSSPFQRKFSSNSPLHGAYESAADSSRYISNAKDFQKLQDTIVKTGLAAKDRVDQVDQWKSEAKGMNWETVNYVGQEYLTDKGADAKKHFEKFGGGFKQKCKDAGGSSKKCNQLFD